MKSKSKKGFRKTFLEFFGIPKVQFSRKIFSFLFLGTIVVLTSGCGPVTGGTRYEPVLLSLEDLRKPVFMEEAKPIEVNGKIVLYKDYLLVNEPKVGVHLFDNSNPEEPSPIGFIAIPGNTDVVVKDDLLYAKSYIDLVTLNISDLDDIKETFRIKAAFEPYYSPLAYGVDPEVDVIIDLIAI